MPDLAIVEQEFVSQIAQILTSEAYQPYAIGYSDVLDLNFRLMRGWVVDNQLVTDLNASPPVTNITVFSQPGQRNTTRFLRRHMHQVVNVPTPTMVPQMFGNQITFSGTGSASELIGVSYGGIAGVSIRLAANDTPTTTAQKLANGLPNSSAFNGVLTINTELPIGVSVGMDVTVLSEVHRQCAIWRVTIWASNPQLRDQFAALIDPNLQGLDRFFFADGSCSGPIIGAGSFVDDVPEKQKLWKRDLLYELEYPTDTLSVVPVMVLGDLGINDLPFYTSTQVQPDYANPDSTSSGGVTGL